MIFVDPLMACIPNKRWRWTQASHLFVAPETDLELLHAFARRIGLRREWFQSKSDLPHYDLNARRRPKAVAAGAVEVDRRCVVDVLRAWRVHNGTPPLTAVEAKCCCACTHWRRVNENTGTCAASSLPMTTGRYATCKRFRRATAEETTESVQPARKLV